MTAAELAAFIAQVRAECGEALARLAIVDADKLPPEVREPLRAAARALGRSTGTHRG